MALKLILALISLILLGGCVSEPQTAPPLDFTGYNFDDKILTQEEMSRFVEVDLQSCSSDVTEPFSITGGCPDPRQSSLSLSGLRSCDYYYIPNCDHQPSLYHIKISFMPLGEAGPSWNYFEQLASEPDTLDFSFFIEDIGDDNAIFIQEFHSLIKWHTQILVFNKSNISISIEAVTEEDSHTPPFSVPQMEEMAKLIENKFEAQGGFSGITESDASEAVTALRAAGCEFIPPEEEPECMYFDDPYWIVTQYGCLGECKYNVYSQETSVEYPACTGLLVPGECETDADCAHMEHPCVEEFVCWETSCVPSDET